MERGRIANKALLLRCDSGASVKKDQPIRRVGWSVFAAGKDRTAAGVWGLLPQCDLAANFAVRILSRMQINIDIAGREFIEEGNELLAAKLADEIAFRH